MPALADDTTSALLRAIVRLRPLPDVASRVLQLVHDPEYSIEELIAIVRTDAALVARLLRVCNSARSGLGREIRAIGDAVSFLGSRHLVQLVLATCSATTFAQASGGKFADPIASWRHSVATAMACQRLCHGLDARTQASAFTVGVLHGIGPLTLDLIATEPHLARIATLPHDADNLTREQAAFGLDHGTVAGLVAAAWLLPGNLALALRGHHDPATIAGDDPLSAALHVADHMAKHLLGESDEVAPGAALAALQRLDLDGTAIDEVAALAKGDLAAMAELLNLLVLAGR